MEHLELIKGYPYLVKHDTGKQTVRRIFKYTEKRFGNILCYVFTGKVNKNVRCEVTENGNEITYRYIGAKHAPNEISIPFYNLKSVSNANI